MRVSRLPCPARSSAQYSIQINTHTSAVTILSLYQYALTYHTASAGSPQPGRWPISAPLQRGSCSPRNIAGMAAELLLPAAVASLVLHCLHHTVAAAVLCLLPAQCSANNYPQECHCYCRGSGAVPRRIYERRAALARRWARS